MVTLVGTQADFNSAVKELAELEYDAIGAYKLAIEKLENLTYKARLEEFLADHARHISEIKQLFIDQLALTDSGDLIKGSLAKLKVVIANAIGSDKSILKAMLTNEIDTNTAYERITRHPDLPANPEMNLKLKLAYEDEKRHKAWLDAEITKFST